MPATPNSNEYIRWKRWTSAFGLFSREDDVYFREELRLCGFEQLARLRVIEVGFGNGSFAGWLADAGGLWTGIEENSALVQKACEAGFTAFHSEAEEGAFAERNQDLVVALDVLEHMEVDQIRSFLGKAHRWLKPQGCLVGRMPSGDSPFSGAIFRGDLTHKTLLGSSALRQIAQEAGFEAVQIRATAFPIAGLGVRRFVRRLLVKTVRDAAGAVIRNALVGERSAVMSPNMTFMLRRVG